MFRLGSFKGAYNGFKKFIFTHCEEEAEVEHDDDDYNTPSIIEQADAAVENDKQRIKTPMQYEDLRGAMMGASTNPYDGFRFIVQKQVNLNTAVSHFYWIGSSAMQGNQLYQYRVILPIDDDKTVNVATDLDFNVEGEVKWGLTPNVLLKSNFAHTGQQQMLSVEANAHDDSSSAQVKYTRSASEEVAVSFMQMLLPNLSVGGMGTYSSKSGQISPSYGFYYDPAEFTLAAQYDNTMKVMYMRKVNPNRVSLGTELVIDEQGGATMGMLAEFQLKQAKLQLGLDSNLVLRSTLDSTINPGTTLQLCAEMQQQSNHYRFGFGIVMG